MSARSSRSRRGFTLLETVCALAVMSIVLAGLIEASHASVEKGAKAADLRALRVMADTVFRRIVYEHWKWDDGMRGTADEWYADFAEIPAGPQRERWKIYRLELRKVKGLVAGTDAAGGLEPLFELDAQTQSGTSTTTGTSGTSTSSGSTGGTGTEDTATGEPAYLVELKVFALEETEPEITLRSIVPVPDSEREPPK